MGRYASVAGRCDNQRFRPYFCSVTFPLLSIDPIDDTLWAGIQHVQAEVYHQIEPESTDTLRSKWLASPDCCFAARTRQGGQARHQAHGPVLAYLLAHAWDSETPPKLYQPVAPGAGKGRYLFLHDLAVSKRAAGLGLGRQMVERLLGVARKLDFAQVRLVAVQGSVPFWRKMGFEAVPGQQASASYGADATVMRRLLKAPAAWA